MLAVGEAGSDDGFNEETETWMKAPLGRVESGVDSESNLPAWMYRREEPERWGCAARTRACAEERSADDGSESGRSGRGIVKRSESKVVASGSPVGGAIVMRLWWW